MASTSISLRKRRNEDIYTTKVIGSCGSPPPKLSYFYMLESASDSSSDERTESIHSIQDKSTDFARDTSDTSTKSELSDFDDSEYEVMSLDSNEQQNPFEDCDTLSSGTDTNIIRAVTISALCDEGDNLDIWADSSSVSSESDEPDRELSPADFWTCVQCKNTNNNPLFRYCEKCFKVRKNFFPPRPHGKKKRKNKSKKKNAFGSHILSGTVDSGISSALESQKSYECSPSTSGEQTFSTNNGCSTPIVNEEKSDSKKNTIKTECTKATLSENDCEKDIDMTKKEDSVEKNCENRVINSLEDNCNLGCVSQASGMNECNSDSVITSFSNQEPLCSTCLINSKNGIFVHGSWAHIYSCYKCSMKIWKDTGRCPICKAKVSQVLKAVVAY